MLSLKCLRDSSETSEKNGISDKNFIRFSITFNNQSLVIVELKILIYYCSFKVRVIINRIFLSIINYFSDS